VPLDRLAVEDKAGFDHGSGFDDPEGITVLIGHQRGERGLEFPAASRKPFDLAVSAEPSHDPVKLGQGE
jgi:hypothetical protein